MAQLYGNVWASEIFRGLVIRPLLERRSAGEPVRAWIIGCDEGQEAYGLAIAIAEEAERAGRSVAPRIFATDSAVESLSCARAGLFPIGLRESISADLLAKYFELRSGGYQVKREIRDQIVFAILDPTQHTPISHIDIILCQLLLKSLEAEARKLLREALLFALAPGGTLRLREGDDIGEIGERLEVLDDEHRLFRRTLKDANSPGASATRSSPRVSKAAAGASPQSPQAPFIRSALLELCPPTVVVDAQGRVIYIRGDVSPYIHYPAGVATENVLELVRAPFRARVRGALRESMRKERSVTFEPNDREPPDRVTVVAAPLRVEEGPTAFRISFLRAGSEETNAPSRSARLAQAEAESSPPAEREASLEKDIFDLRRKLQAVTAAFEETQESLAMANEELASTNEELMSANEELAANLTMAEQLNAKAEEAARAKDEFISTMSHELRTPLNTIRLWSKVLESGHVEQGKVIEAARVIDRAVSAQRRLIDDLLDVSRMAAGRLQLARRDVAMAEVVRSAVETVGPQAESRRIALTCALDEDAGTAHVDPDRIQKVIWNLLTNAVKFTPDGGRVDVRMRRVDCAIEVEVRDTGVGIRPEFLPHVFERFRQGDGGIARRHGGLGLGLAIAKDLMELHGGTITAHSPGEGKGSTFVVRLPLEEEAGPGDAVSPRGVDPEARDLKGVEVLLIEDEEMTRNATTQLLSEYNALFVRQAPEYRPERRWRAIAPT